MLQPTDEEPTAAKGGARPNLSATEGRATIDEGQRQMPLRMSLRPPARYSADADLELWLTRFELNVREARIPEDQWTKELLPLLEDEPFRVIAQLGLVQSTDYEAVITGLHQQISSEGTELEWQYRLQSRTQKSGEKFAEYAGALRVLADKAYSRWSAAQRQEVLRNHFIQGIQSSPIQLHLMREMPPSLDEALRLAVQQQAVETAQRRLHRETHRLTDSAFCMQNPAQEVGAATRGSDVTNTVTESNTSQIAELTRQVRRLAEELSQLQKDKTVRQQGRGPCASVHNTYIHTYIHHA